MENSRIAEQNARVLIDALLSATGWIVQNYRAFSSTAGRGIALREVPLKTGPCDYLLLVERKAVGVIEPKKTGSRVYFEQMKGRGTRVLSPTDLRAVSGAEARAKTHFVIIDAVGVCESDKTESRSLERQPGVAFGKRDEDSLTSLDCERTASQRQEPAV